MKDILTWGLARIGIRIVRTRRRYAQDGIVTIHNDRFRRVPAFRAAYRRGLKAGERVVSSGTFLIDSESQMKAAASGMGAPQHKHGTAPAANPPAANQSANPPAAKPMDPLMPIPEPKTPAPGRGRHD